MACAVITTAAAVQRTTEVEATATATATGGGGGGGGGGGSGGRRRRAAAAAASAAAAVQVKTNAPEPDAPPKVGLNRDEKKHQPASALGGCAIPSDCGGLLNALGFPRELDLASVPVLAGLEAKACDDSSSPALIAAAAAAAAAGAGGGGGGARQRPVYTLEEVSKHTTKADCWLAISGNVYRVCEGWFNKHPGGEHILLNMAGKDCTDPFIVFHPESVVTGTLPIFQIGTLENWAPTPLQADFHAMRNELERGGYFKTRMSYYVSKLLVQLILIGLTVLFIARGTHAVHYLIASLFAGMFWQQIAFLGHDVGHNAVFAPQKWKDWLCGLIITLFFGVSVQWWKRNHNQHHFFVNHVQYDPDIQYLPLFSISENMLKGYFSLYHNAMFQWNRVSKFLVSWQHILYYPVMAVARLNLNLQSILFVFDPRNAVWARPYEMIALTGYWMWYVFLVSFIPTWTDRFWFCMVSNALTGLTHVQITLSHFAMPTIDGAGYDPANPNHFISAQFTGSMNIECDERIDWLHGGLQFQIEHHLFPRIPRHNLRYVMNNYIRPFAARHSLPYLTLGFMESNRMVFGSLRAAAYKAREFPVSDPSASPASGSGSGGVTSSHAATNSLLYQFINAEG